ncbi:MAG: S8 family serine peptidase [Hamadaea sp.]|uniref:S8 family peptidase n=1 Tax=Hamadaea sp. TaxID=2024425 RepID=UPI001819BE96|nr:S8 family serine peptidase [Hamadaea sp.]NUR71004.1 S8 family serine peptidase [Hamadaea sp.]NUT23685.1 S8 family serine peptidase [Hamadaea sp.]
MHVHSRRTRGVRIAAAATLTLSVLAVPTRTGAAESHPLVGSAGSASSAAAAAGREITLITGDRALLTIDAQGHPAATLIAGPAAADGYVTRQFRGDLYVIPAQAMPLISQGKLDEELFNVTALARQGYDDAATGQLPLLATYAGQVARTREAPKPLDGTSVAATLPIADAVALTAAKEKTAELWRDLTDGEGPEIGKLWLDGKVTADMAESNAQIHSAQAWAAGFDGAGVTVAVLDSGYDATHPDLAGQVVNAKNFTTESGGAVDRNGHGTHVASTIAGTGAASGGTEKGVAPGAKLLVGKVLNYAGSGQDSWIIAGMQWAVDSGADVVSMSLGSSSPSDCTDPMGVAAQKLTEQSKTLFVVAAANAGPALQTISAPGCAPGVLTVGAVDSAGGTAWFSSRGPVIGRHTVKPEIAGPGVGIVAAALNTGGYIAMSGTSMATPHVAAVAALLKQRHPDWTAQQRKTALISAATPSTTATVYEQGSGLLDAYKPLTATVFGPGTAYAGSFSWPHLHQDPVTTPVTLTNTGDKAVTFDLAIVGATGEDGTALANKTLTVGASKVTVPAQGTATVPVVFDPAKNQTAAAYGNVGGRLVATAADGATVTTAVGAYLEPHYVSVNLHVLDRRGQAPASPSFVDVVDADRLTAQRFTVFTTDPVLRLREGSYSITAVIASRDEGTTGAAGLVKSISFLGDPDLRINNDDVDHTITYDARDAVRQEVRGNRPLEAQSTAVEFVRDWDGVYLAAGMVGGSSVDDVYIGRTKPVINGDFTVGTFYRMYAPELALRTTGGLTLGAEYIATPTFGPLMPVKFDGNGQADVVAAGTGTAAELAAAGVSGKVAFVVGAGNIGTVLTAAAAAGAKAVVFGQAAAGRWTGVATVATTVPGVTVSGADTTALQAALAAGPVTLAWQGTAASPYVYNLAFTDTKKTQPDVTKWVRDDDLASVTENFYAQRTDRPLIDFVRAYWDGFPVTITSSQQKFAAPFTRTAYFTAGRQWQSLVGGAGVFSEVMLDVPRTYAAGSARTADWYKAPVRSTGTRRADWSPEHIGERQEGLIGMAMLPFGDSDPDHWSGGGSFGDGGNAELLRDGVSLGKSAWPSGLWDVPDADGAYELKVSTGRFSTNPVWYPGWNMFRRTDTSFRFRSARPSDAGLYALPLLVPTYDIPADQRSLTPARAGFQLGFGATGQRDYDAGTIVAAKAWVSVDDGTTWTEVPVARSGAGFTATVDQSAGAGKYVSLRVDLTDEHGNGVQQTIIRAYGVQ